MEKCRSKEEGFSESRKYDRIEDKVRLFDKRLLKMQPVELQEIRMASYCLFGMAIFMAGFLVPLGEMNQKQRKLAILVALFIFSANVCYMAPVLRVKENHVGQTIADKLLGSPISGRILRRIRLKSLWNRMGLLTAMMLLVQFVGKSAMREEWSFALIFQTIVMMVGLGVLASLQILATMGKIHRNRM